MNIARKVLLPVGLGFVGMFIAHILILLGFAVGIRFPIYIIAYPAVYTLMAVVLGLGNSTLWISDSVLVYAPPSLYWYLLLWSDGRLDLQAALTLERSSQMILVLPVSLGLSCLSTFLLSRLRKSDQQAPNGVGS